MNVEILPYPKDSNSYFICFPGEKNEQKIEKIFSEVMASLIYKSYLVKPTIIFSCEKTGDYYFPIKVKRARPSLLDDIKISISQALEK